MSYGAFKNISFKKKNANFYFIMQIFLIYLNNRTNLLNYCIDKIKLK